MKEKEVIKLIEDQDWLDTAADAIQPKVIAAFEEGGEQGRELKDFLQGTWLGHPLHPALTDIPIGAYTTAAVLDGLEILGKKSYRNGADTAIGLGLLGAVGAAATGLTDWTETRKKKRRLGLMHGLLNLTATTLYATSYILRKRNSRGAALGFAFLGYGVTGMAAYLGGSLVFGKQEWTDHRENEET